MKAQGRVSVVTATVRPGVLAEGMASVSAAAKGSPVTYTAMCEREGGWWIITVPDLESGRVTQARTLDDVPATVADLVATMTDIDPALVKVKVEAETGPGLGFGKIALVGVGAVGAAAALAWRLIRAAAGTSVP